MWCGGFYALFFMVNGEWKCYNRIYKLLTKGYAKGIMNKLLSDAEEKNLSIVELKSTEDGYRLYQSVGFVDEVSKYHTMTWYNQ